LNSNPFSFILKKYKRTNLLICLIIIYFLIPITLPYTVQIRKEKNHLFNQNYNPNLAQASNYYYSALNVTWGDSGDDEGYTVKIDSGENIYIAGHTFNTEKNREDVILIKYNPSATQIWERTFGENANDRIYGLTFDSYDNIYLTGSTVSREPAHNLKLYKYNSSGEELLDKTWGWTPDDDYGRNVAVDSNNYIYVIGATETNDDGYDIEFLKYDSSGNQIEDKTWGGSDDDIGYDIEIDSNDNFYVIGTTKSYGSGSGDIILIKFDSSGNVIWNQTWGNSLNDEGSGLALDSNGDIYVLGKTTSYGAGEDDIVLIKYNSSGYQYWNKTWGGLSSDLGMDIAIDNNNSVIVVGSTESFGSGFTDGVLLKFNSSGNLLWNQTWGGSSRDVGRGVAIDSNNIIYIIGTTESYGASSKDIILLIYSNDSDNDGLLDWSEIKIYSTNPLDSDTDSDGYSDEEEVSSGTNPLLASDNIETRKQLTDFIIMLFIFIPLIFIAFVPIFIIIKNARGKIKEHKIEKIEKIEQKKIEELERENLFENLMRKSKDLVEKANKYYNKSNYMDAIKNWEEAIKNYQLALQKYVSNEVKLKITRNQKELNKNICNAHIKHAKNIDDVAIKSHNEQDLEEAEKKWKIAKKSYQNAIDIIKSERFETDLSPIESKINSIDLYLIQVEIEKICVRGDVAVEKAQSLQNEDLNQANKVSEESYELYSKALTEANKYPQFKDLAEIIKNKMNNVRLLQEEIKEKRDELIGITAPTTKIIVDDLREDDSSKIKTIIKGEKRESALIIKREYEFIGGQVRFKISLENNTTYPLTNFKINFDIPISLKWIIHDPIEYKRKGDTIYIPKIGLNERPTISLWLEPTQCTKSPINAIISFHDARDKPQAITMNPKEILIECPLLFTESEANLAKVKSRHRSLKHCDAKFFPIINLEKLPLIYSSVLNALGKHHIQLVYKEFSEKDNFGEIWYYGTTKVKENQIIVHALLNGENRTLELEVSGDSEQQITAFLAEIGKDLRAELKNKKIITDKDKFYDIKISVFSNECPYCGGKVPPELIEKYRCGESINCQYCRRYLICGT
jgi:uncharacterized delta-60 repeat protein